DPRPAAPHRDRDGLTGAERTGPTAGTRPPTRPARESPVVPLPSVRRSGYTGCPSRREANVETHGDETYFVIGEGLLGQSGGGREHLLAAGTAQAQLAPPFRFSRMGPSGLHHQVSDTLRKKLAAAMTTGPEAFSKVPSGFTYLGQFVDHDLTFDKTN